MSDIAPRGVTPSRALSLRGLHGVGDVMDDAAGDRLVSNVVGHLSNGVSAPVLERAFEYGRNVDKETGDRIANGFREPSTSFEAARRRVGQLPSAARHGARSSAG